MAKLLLTVVLVWLTLQYELLTVHAQLSCKQAGDTATYTCLDNKNFRLCTKGEDGDLSTTPCDSSKETCVGGIDGATESDKKMCVTHGTVPAPYAKALCTSNSRVKLPVDIAGASDVHCSYYYLCTGLNARPLLMACGKDEQFSVTDEKCVAKSAGKCQTSQGDDSCKTGGLERYSFLENKTHCTDYLACNLQGLRVSVKCPNGENFDAKDKVCKPAASVDCGTRKPTGPVCTKATDKFKDDKSCKKFYACPNYPGSTQSESRTCPFEYYFNEQTQKCGSDSSICGSRSKD